MPVERKKSIPIRLATLRKRHVNKNKVSGFESNQVVTLTAFENENSIDFIVARCRDPKLGRQAHWEELAKYRFGCYVLKDGSKDFRFYFLRRTQPRRVQARLANPYKILDNLASCCPVPAKKRQEFKLPVSKFIKIINRFLRKYKVKTKYLPQDPCGRMLLACYPGLSIYPIERLKRASLTKWAKKDIAQYCLNTKGAKTKNLLKRIPPPDLSNVLEVAKKIKTYYTLDHAQAFLDKVISPENIVAVFVSFFNLADSTSIKFFIKNIKQFKHYTPNAFLSIFDDQRLFDDTIRMMQRAVFNPLDIEHKNIRELHDALIALNPRPRNRIRDPLQELADAAWEQTAAKTIFSCPLYMQYFIKTMNPVRPDWELICASSQEELDQWSATMQNCIRVYTNKCTHGVDGFIFAIAESGEMKYNIEIGNHFNIIQAVGKYNKKIQGKDLDDLMLITTGAIYLRDEPLVRSYIISGKID